MKKFLFKDFWLRLLALILAIVVYYTLESGTSSFNQNHDRKHQKS